MIPQIVILPGWEQNKNAWREFIDKFQEDQATVIELPGFGDEPRVSADWGIPQYAEWAKERIENLQEKNIALLGHSFGGRIAGFIASENPQWLKGLILYATPSIYIPNFYIRFKIVAAKFFKKIGFLRKLKNKELQRIEKNGLGKIFRKAVSFDQTEQLPNIKTPTLIIWGRDDSEVSLKIGQEMNDLISGSKLVIMDNVGHNAHLENPILFYGIVKNFVENI